MPIASSRLPPSRLVVGVDVPFVTSWSEEIPNGVGPCPTVDGRMAALQTWNPGVGKPLYSRNHLRRQRDSVRAMLCPMCGKVTEPHDRWTQTGRYTSAGVLRARDFGRDVPADLEDERVLLDAGAIAPLHGQCAKTSLERCPHLGGMAERDLKPFPRAWVVIPLYARVSKGGGPGLAVVTFLQLIGVTEQRDPDWRDLLAQG